MLYAIISQDVENSLERRIGARPEHIDRLNKLKDEELTSDNLKIIIITNLNEIHTKYINY